MASTPTRRSRLSRLSKQQCNQDPPRAKWTMYLTQTLADLMVEQVQKGDRKNNSFDKKAWEYMCAEFHMKTGLNWDKEKLKNRCAVLKKQYATMKSLLDQNDFSWDESQGRVMATDEAWDEYIKAHPDAEAIRIHGCPIYRQLCIIFSESGAIEHHDQLNDLIGLDEATPMFFDVPTIGLPIDCRTSSAFVDEETSSSMEEENNGRKNRCKHQSVTPPPPRSVRQKKIPTGTEDVIAKAILEIASASKLRAAAVMQSSERFSITNCINALDELQGMDDNLYYAALDLFDKPNSRELFMSLKLDKRLAWLKGKCSASNVNA